MAEAPPAVLEVEQEEVPAHAAQLEEAELGEAPEALDAVDVRLTPDEFVGLVVD